MTSPDGSVDQADTPVEEDDRYTYRHDHDFEERCGYWCSAYEKAGEHDNEVYTNWPKPEPTREPAPAPTPKATDFAAAPAAIEASIRLGIDAERDDPNLTKIVTAFSDDQIRWLSRWLAGEGFTR